MPTFHPVVFSGLCAGDFSSLCSVRRLKDAAAYEKRPCAVVQCRTSLFQAVREQERPYALPP
ncbi:hypothetical protein TRIP_B40064 [uncultured Desulfatiglans sp.]|nr:hypothetical protein TRIP_B40064 [uncultured Desulfatiglans sp.]